MSFSTHQHVRNKTMLEDLNAEEGGLSDLMHADKNVAPVQEAAM